MNGYVLGFLGSLANIAGVGLIAGPKSDLNSSWQQRVLGLGLLWGSALGAFYAPPHEYAWGLLSPAIVAGPGTFLLQLMSAAGHKERMKFNSMCKTAIGTAIVTAIFAGGPAVVVAIVRGW